MYIAITISHFISSRMCLAYLPKALLFLAVSSIMATKPTFAESPKKDAQSESAGPAESTYADRVDSFEEKMKLLQDAWQRKDYHVARSLTHSIRDSVIQAEVSGETVGVPIGGGPVDQSTDRLPEPWRRWSAPWKYWRMLAVNEPVGSDRRSEPVEATLSFPVDHADSLQRELRLAKIVDGQLQEVPCQVFGEIVRGNERRCNVLWLADANAKRQDLYLVFVGNPAAELPNYPSDMTTQGEKVALDVENAFFKASLSRQTGQLERLTLKREHGLEIFSGGEGHGEPAGIDWAHDYMASGGFQKFRISLWDECPDFEVVRGPLCTIVRRWGFPYSPIHPVFAPSRLHVDIEYRFYSGLPWFHKIGSMEAVKEFEAEALRDDEWVFSGYSFTDKVWMDRDGKLKVGDVDQEHKEDIWGVGFFNRTSKDSFIALFLEHRAEGLPELKHAGEPTLSYRWHGNLWSRYPLPVKRVPRGAVLRQKNAYVSIPFTETEGPAEIEALRRQLVNPLVVSDTKMPQFENAVLGKVPLAREGETADANISKDAIWKALQDCKDAQLYTANINVVELGLVYDVRVLGDVVTVIMAMPHRGRPRMGYFTHGSISVHREFSRPVRERLMQVPGVRQVVVEQTWEPAWNSNRITAEGRRKLGL
ncbi:MAG: metal-sulfur cluster assembly factor [Planctomycetota bacterium]|nr:metal-sulfur cluster assembly factor [Planctomycetota bacterium]